MNWSALRQRRFARRYAQFVSRYPGWIMTVLLSLTAFSLLISIEWLEADHSATALFGSESQEMQLYERYTNEFGEPDDLIVVVEHGSAQDRQLVVQQLAHRLDQEPLEVIARVMFQIPIKDLASLLHADEADVSDLLATLQDKEHLLNQALEAPNIETLFSRMAALLKKGLKEESFSEDPTPFFKGAARMFEAFDESIRQAQPGAGPLITKSGGEILDKLDEADAKGFMVADGGRVHLMFIKPGDTAADAEAASALVKLVRGHIQELELPEGVTIGLTGQPALTHDEFEISERDMMWATLFALFTTALIFYLAFRNVAHPLFGFSCLVMSVILTFGLTTLTIGHLNLISLSFAVILIGLGTQYGVHIIARYEEERGRGRGDHETVFILMHQTVPSLWVGALTTSAAFFATMLINFKGFRELAFIAGSGVLICFIVMSFALPAFLVWFDKRRRKPFQQKAALMPAIRTGVGRFYVNAIERSPRLIVSGAGLLSVLAVLVYLQWGPVPRFDYNLLNLQADGVESVRLEKRLLETHVSPRFAIYMAESRQEAQDIVRQLEALPEIGRVESLFTLMPHSSLTKLEKVRAVGQNLQDRLAFGNRPSKPAAVEASLQELQRAFAQAEEKLFAGGYADAVTAAGEAGTALEAGQKYLNSLPEPEAIRKLNELQEDLSTELGQFINAESRRDLATLGGSLPTSLKERFLSPNYVYAIYAYPSQSIWTRDGLTSFVNALRSISDKFSGPPLQMYAALSAMDSGWYLSALLAAAAIFLIFLWDFKSLAWAGLATVPLFCGLAWIYGGMAVFQLRWNIVNLIALPLVLGIGADCGIHLIHRYRENKGKDISFVLSSTGKAVTVAYSDTLTSFLGLAVATHQGLASLGSVIIWGIFCCYLAGMVVLPALLSAWPLKAAQNGDAKA